MTDAASSRRMNAILFALLALVVLLFGWFWISNPVRSLGDTTGTIEAITVRPSTEDHAAAERTAMIRLADGTLVQARVVTSESVRSGQRAKVHVSEQVLSGTRNYEVLEPPDTRRSVTWYARRSSRSAIRTACRGRRISRCSRARCSSSTTRPWAPASHSSFTASARNR